MSIKKKRFPSMWALITLWMKQNFSEKPALVFRNPGHPDYVTEVTKYIKGNTHVELVMSEYAILPMRSLDKALQVCHQVPDSQPYTAVWDGKCFVSENT